MYWSFIGGGSPPMSQYFQRQRGLLGSSFFSYILKIRIFKFHFGNILRFGVGCRWSCFSENAFLLSGGAVWFFLRQLRTVKNCRRLRVTFEMLPFRAFFGPTSCRRFAWYLIHAADCKSRFVPAPMLSKYRCICFKSPCMPSDS